MGKRLFWTYFLLVWLLVAVVALLFGVEWRWLVGVLVVAFVPAFFLAKRFAQNTMNPIHQLIQHANHVAASRVSSPILPTAQDELSALIRSFNTAIATLQSENTFLAEERHQFLTISAMIGSGMVIIDQNGVIQRVNQAAEAVLEIDEEKAVGATVAQVVRHHQLIELWQECRHSGKSSTTALEFNRHGKNMFWQVTFSPFISGNSNNFLLLIQDLSEVRHLQIVRRDFISNISHELRTPLASMKALVETLLDGAIEDPDMAIRFLSRANVEVDAMAQMVEELQELARIESGQVPLQLQSVTVSDLILPAFERMQTQAEGGQLGMVVNLPAKLPPVLADPARISQVLTNLISNAIKYTQPGGQISVRAKPHQNMVLIEVEDTGAGIPAKDLPRIFERFYKADRARTSGGTGLGLAIARHLVKVHGGEIWVKSKEKKGSTFYFTLPLAGVSSLENF